MGLLTCGRMCQCDHLCVNWGCHVAALKAGTKVGDWPSNLVFLGGGVFALDRV